MSRPQNGSQTFPQPQNSPLGPQKVKNDHKLESKSNVRIGGNIENECCSTILVLPENFLNSHQPPILNPYEYVAKVSLSSNSSFSLELR